MYYGIRLHYFYFDRDEKLIGLTEWYLIDQRQEASREQSLGLKPRRSRRDFSLSARLFPKPDLRPHCLEPCFAFVWTGEL
jgi:hypothetical protein